MGSKRYKFSRYGMYSAIKNALKSFDYPLEPGKCLLIGDTLNGEGSNTAITDMLPKGCHILAPDYPEVDIQFLGYASDSFDYVIADQVLEHVRKPWLAIRQVHRVLVRSGIAIFTSCLMQSIHGVPNDYWRFTQDGLRVLFEDFIILSTGQNGNLDFINMCETRYRGESVKDNPNLIKKAIDYNNKCPLTVWIIARKAEV